MRILFNAAPTHSGVGGGRIKLSKLKENLERMGHEADLFDQWNTKIGEYDIYHHFSMFKWDYPIIRLCKLSGVPIAVETMYWSDWRYVLTAPLERSWSRVRLILHYMVKTFFPRITPQRAVLHMADVLISNSKAEAVRVGKHFAISQSKIRIAPNGFDERFAEGDPDLFIKEYGIKDFVLNVGGIGPQKNQVKLIRALKGSKIPIVFIGAPSAVNPWYMRFFNSVADNDVHLIGPIDHDSPMLASAYAAARVFALPSTWETTGKAALEAAASGTRVVITDCEPTHEYFGEHARYISPNNIKGLRESILESYEKSGKDMDLRDWVLSRYTWSQVMPQRLKIYQELKGQSVSPN